MQIDEAVRLLRQVEAISDGTRSPREFSKVAEDIMVATNTIISRVPGAAFEFISRMCVALDKIPGAQFQSFPDLALEAVEDVFGATHPKTSAAARWRDSMRHREKRRRVRGSALKHGSDVDTFEEEEVSRRWKRARSGLNGSIRDASRRSGVSDRTLVPSAGAIQNDVPQPRRCLSTKAARKSAPAQYANEYLFERDAPDETRNGEY